MNTDDAQMTNGEGKGNDNAFVLGFLPSRYGGV
jgi:hypothetical protein